ncbi:ribbon-helix-helix domain-containing protein [Sinanaerobacter sp. ZZT-01]|uniref:ribbon-helix-helix domain-containing protein n=1 Tax=Sinanaerobacter sp. ZZT-01 TaxID=3111540 RepID=UPI002D76CBCB|nr:ribbon-helix-helix domain-containing protein [Sinanaerobacter sp. ZZT-01]WRR93928.1 ribbon-helix-helix domain-containing protein [Sinanaerobacter sp. ZZT-01]
MAKKSDRIITSVYLTKEMCGEIDKLAARENVSRNEQIRRFIEKGLDIEGYTQNVDFISSIIRQEFTAVYHIEDIKAVAEQQTNRLAKMLMKSGKIDAAGFFLLIKVLMNLAHDGTEDQFDQMLNEAVTLGVDYMQKKDFQINSFLQDTDNLRGLADKL